METLADAYKKAIYDIQQEIDTNDLNLKNADSTVERLSEEQTRVKEKTNQLFSYSKKVLSRQRRCGNALEIIKSFENNIAKYVREFIKICETCNQADSFHRVQAPSSFLSDMLGHCELRIKDIEKNINDIEEILKLETSPPHFSMLVQTISSMFDKFKVVSSLASEMHNKINNFQQKISENFREIYHQDTNFSLFEAKDETDILTSKAEENYFANLGYSDRKQTTFEKENERRGQPYSALKGSIVGKVGMLSAITPRKL